MADGVADEGVGHAVPVRAERFVRKRCQVAGHADCAGVSFLRRVERETERVPGAGLKLANDFPFRSVTQREFLGGHTHLDRERRDDAAPKVEAIRAAFVRGGDGAEVHGEVHLLAGRGLERAGEDIADAVVGLAGADAHAARADGVDVGKGALRVGEDFVRAGGEPRCGGRLAELLQLQAEVRPAADGLAVERDAVGFEFRERGVEAGKLGDLQLVEPSGFLARDERGKVRRSLLLLAAGERPARALEDAVERIEIRCADGVILVVVAARAAEREAEQRAADGINRIGEIEVLVVGRGLVAVALANREEAGGGDAAGVLVRRALRGEKVAGDLLADELVEGLVGVEGVHDPVAILHGLAHGVVRAVAGGVGVAGDIEPVAAPALAVGRGGEQALDERLVCTPLTFTLSHFLTFAGGR